MVGSVVPARCEIRDLVRLLPDWDGGGEADWEAEMGCEIEGFGRSFEYWKEVLDCGLGVRMCCIRRMDQVPDSCCAEARVMSRDHVFGTTLNVETLCPSSPCQATNPGTDLRWIRRITNRLVLIQ